MENLSQENSKSIYIHIFLLQTGKYVSGMKFSGVNSVYRLMGILCDGETWYGVGHKGGAKLVVYFSRCFKKLFSASKKLYLLFLQTLIAYCH